MGTIVFCPPGGGTGGAGGGNDARSRSQMLFSKLLGTNGPNSSSIEIASGEATKSRGHDKSIGK